MTILHDVSESACVIEILSEERSFITQWEVICYRNRQDNLHLAFRRSDITVNITNPCSKGAKICHEMRGSSVTFYFIYFRTTGVRLR